MNDVVNHPAHYTDGNIEVADYIYAERFDFFLGNVIKYISRAGKKDSNKTIEDLEKARWYLVYATDKMKEAMTTATSTENTITPEDFIDDKNFNFFLGSVVKLVSKAEDEKLNHESTMAINDLRTATNYLDHEINKLKSKNKVKECISCVDDECRFNPNKQERDD